MGKQREFTKELEKTCDETLGDKKKKGLTPAQAKNILHFLDLDAVRAGLDEIPENQIIEVGEKLALFYKGISAEEKRLKEMKDKAKDIIGEIMDRTGETKLELGTSKATLSTSKTPTLKIDGDGLFAEYKVAYWGWESAKEEIEERLKKGEEIPGAKLTFKKSYIRIS